MSLSRAIHSCTSALIVLSHNDRVVRTLIIGCPLYSNTTPLAKTPSKWTEIEEKLKIPTSEFCIRGEGPTPICV